MTRQKANKGFTLLETLVVIFVVTTFVLLPTIVFQSWQQILQQRFCLYRLEKLVLHHQQLAITENKNTYIDLHNDKELIIFALPGETLAWKHFDLPATIDLKSGGRITFKAGSGNITGDHSAGSIPKILLQVGEESVTYQFQLGSGRFVKK